MTNVAADLERVLARVPAAVYVAEPGLDGRRLYMSEHIEVLSGYPAKRWIEDATLWREVIHPDDLSGRVADEAHWSSSATDGRVVSSEYRLLRPDGATVWMHDAARLAWVDNAVVWVGVLTDVSESRGVLSAAAAGEAHFRSLAEWSPDALLQIDPEGRIAYVSPAALTVTPGLFSFQSGQSWVELIHPEEQPQAEAFHAAIWAGEETARLRFRAMGSEDYLEATGRLIRGLGGAGTGLALSLRRVQVD
ncbi:MAG TPA: PAS domain-containing protein [Solirubrobacteraceae bacterium]|nr:PAS domain-containing protein [Solirubrobacteraceae bacterium]